MTLSLLIVLYVLFSRPQDSEDQNVNLKVLFSLLFFHRAPEHGRSNQV
jgi:hypothetical protein